MPHIAISRQCNSSSARDAYSHTYTHKDTDITIVLTQEITQSPEAQEVTWYSIKSNDSVDLA